MPIEPSLTTGESAIPVAQKSRTPAPDAARSRRCDDRVALVLGWRLVIEGGQGGTNSRRRETQHYPPFVQGWVMLYPQEAAPPLLRLMSAWTRTRA